MNRNNNPRALQTLLLSDACMDALLHIFGMDGETESMDRCPRMYHRERSRRRMAPPRFSHANGCSERRIDMLEATSPATRGQAKTLFWGTKTLPKNTDDPWA